MALAMEVWYLVYVLIIETLKGKGIGWEGLLKDIFFVGEGFKT